jgi:hypothetical protein
MPMADDARWSNGLFEEQPRPAPALLNRLLAVAPPAVPIDVDELIAAVEQMDADQRRRFAEALRIVPRSDFLWTPAADGDWVAPQLAEVP